MTNSKAGFKGRERLAGYMTGKKYTEEIEKEEGGLMR